MTALFALAAMDAMAINKCVDPSGKVTYQDDKCPDETKKGKVRAAPPSSAEKLPARDDMDDADLNSMAVAVAYMERCGALSPAYARNAAAVMEAYRLKHAASLARYERTKPFQDILRDSRAGTAEIAKNPAAREDSTRYCGTIKEKPAATGSGGAKRDGKNLPADVDHVIDVEAAFNVCAYGLPGWFDQMRAAYEAWAKRNFALTSRIHGDYDLEKEYQSRSARRSISEPGLCINVASIIQANK